MKKSLSFEKLFDYLALCKFSRQANSDLLKILEIFRDNLKINKTVSYNMKYIVSFKLVLLLSSFQCFWNKVSIHILCFHEFKKNKNDKQ